MKKIFLTVVILPLFAFNVFANFPVIDVTKLLASIERYLTLLDQLESGSTEIENTVKQLENVRKQMESLKFEDIKGGNFKEKFRGMMKSSMSYVNMAMNLEKEAENMINDPKLSFGNQKFSVKDLFDPQTLAEAAEEGINFVYSDSKNMTDEDKMEFWAKYGLSPLNYRRMGVINSQIDDIGKTILGKFEAKKKMAEEDAKKGVDEAEVKVAMSTESQMTVEQVEVAQNEKELQRLAMLDQSLMEKAKFDVYVQKEQLERRAAAQKRRSGNQVTLEGALELGKRFLAPIEDNQMRGDGKIKSWLEGGDVDENGAAAYTSGDAALKLLYGN